LAADAGTTGAVRNGVEVPPNVLAKAAEPGASVSAVARRYGIARRVSCRWRQEQAAAGTVFVDVEIIEVPRACEEVAS